MRLSSAKKIKKKHGRLYGVIGLTGMLDVLADWHNADAQPDKMPPKAEFLMLVCDGKTVVELSNEAPYAVEVCLPWAIGSGWGIAYGIMLQGGSPKRAIELVAKHHIRTGGAIQEENIAKALGLAKSGDPPAQTYLPHPDKPDKFLIRQQSRKERVA